MAIKIRTKAGGTSTAKRSSTTKGSTAAPKRRGRPPGSKNKSTTAKRSTASNGRKRGGPRGPRIPNLPKGVLDKHTKALTNAGEALVEAQQAHTDAINDVYSVAGDALEAGLTMAMVSDLTGVSRQWLYKMGEHGGRNGSGSKSAAKRAVKKTAAAKKTTTRGRKPAAKTGGKRGGVKIRSRS